MFDELDKQNANSAPTRPVTPAGAAPNVIPPASLPNGQAAGTKAPARTEDIFARVDKIPKPVALQPRPDNPLLSRPTVIPQDDSWLKNKTMILSLALGGLIIVLGGGYLGLKMMMKKAPPADMNTAVQEQAQNVQVEPEAPAAAVPETNNIVEPPIQPEVIQPVDGDLDGLTDEEEATLGTNANNSDTDQDGLTDREEAKVYGTDPLKADTDGDGYTDGAEVKNGYNPKGAGKLLDINNQ